MARRFRKRAMEVYGYKKGFLEAMLENSLKRFVFQEKLAGVLRNS
ncbi:MAG: hypothetical protein ACUVQ0_06355 [Thermoproteota archaeon]